MALSNPRRAVLTQPAVPERRLVLPHLARHAGGHRPVTVTHARATLRRITQVPVPAEVRRLPAQPAEKIARLAEERLIPTPILRPEVRRLARLAEERVVPLIQNQVRRHPQLAQLAEKHLVPAFTDVEHDNASSFQFYHLRSGASNS
ncbi:MAG: hypothetical protein LBT05_08940 [Planctomycetaceae bacterium]|nr:hypothetical protein [Planctomycetaceae bacterium]